MSNKKIFMSVTATAVIASAFVGAEKADAATHTVQSGDTLWSIAQKYDTNVTQLQTWNTLNNDIIFPDQKLEVGDGGKSNSDTSSDDKNASEVNEQQAAETAKSNENVASAQVKSTKVATYTVKNGDTLGAIAYDHGISLDKLMTWNDLESTLIFPGDIFIVTQSASKPDKNVSAPAAPVKDEVSKEESPAEKPATKPTEKEPVKEESVKEKPAKDKPAAVESKPEADSNTSEKAATYTVKRGDTLNAIAAAHRISLDNLMAWNNLKTTLIFPGDTLTVKKGAKIEKPTKKPTDPKREKADNQPTDGLINTAKSALGTPYIWGGSTMNGFDCSGFIHWSLANSGTNMTRQSTEGYYNRSYIVNTPEIGDFVFFENTYKKGISHMGIYLGGNKFIHASTSQGVTITNLDNPYWSERFHSYKKLY